MNLNRLKCWPQMGLLACGLMSAAATGCQTTIGGQTLPSAYYLDDDVQYFPAGPEFLLPNQVRAIEEYKLQQAAIAEGLEAPPPIIGPGPGAPAFPPGGPAGPGGFAPGEPPFAPIP